MLPQRPDMSMRQFTSYFAESSGRKHLLYLLILLYVISTSVVVIIEPLVSFPCDEDNNPKSELEYENVLYHYSPCSDVRYPMLLYFTKTECLRGRHLLMAVFFGSLIGYERRSSDRPAGIRTMALVSLGSALFTINSTFAFLSGPMSWDASRVSAAIPSGVGFLGAGLIVKSSDKDPITGERQHLVQGITTAAATWLSAAIGIACGGGMYFTAGFTTALNLLILRFGPRATEDDGRPSIQMNVYGGDIEAGEKPASYGGVAESAPLNVPPSRGGNKQISRRNRASLSVH